MGRATVVFDVDILNTTLIHVRRFDIVLDSETCTEFESTVLLGPRG